MRNKLHDEIDELEDAREKAQAIVDALKPRLLEIAKNTDSMRELFTEAALLVENELATLTTDTANKFIDLGVRRSIR